MVFFVTSDILFLMMCVLDQVLSEGYAVVVQLDVAKQYFNGVQ